MTAVPTGRLWTEARHGPLPLPLPRDAAALLALAMGVQNAAARHLAVPDLTTTVLTMTLTGIASDWQTPNRRPALARRLLAVLTMFAGAIAGAWLVLDVSAPAALAAATALVALVTAGAATAYRSPGQWRAVSP